MYFSRKFGVRYVDDSWPYPRVDDLRDIARIIGEAKQLAHKAQPAHCVVLRGQTSHHAGMLPSLFRQSATDPSSLQAAENAFFSRVRQTIPVSRFRRPSVGALLQHCGFKTSWLDALDNTFVDSRFAAHDLRRNRQGMWSSRTSNKETGWLFVFSAPADTVVDLRESHHPLSTRPHVQHGVSIPSSEHEPDLRRLAVATLRIPVHRVTGGRLLDQSNLFPPAHFDPTLRLLLRRKADRLAAAVEDEFGLHLGALGGTMQFLEPRTKP